LTITVIAIVLGLVISAACIGIPHLVRIRRQQPDDDSQDYLKQTGRSSREVAQEDAALLAAQENAGRSRRASGADGPFS
jgi:hypothetical protein